MTLFSRMPCRITVVIPAVVLSVFVTGCFGQSFKPSAYIRKSMQEQAQTMDFSPDGKKIALTYCRTWKKCFVRVKNLETGRVDDFGVDSTSSWLDPRFSKDSRFIAFVIRNPNRGWIGHKGRYRALAIMNSDGSNVRTLTDDDAWRADPSFSPDGKRLIYAKSTSPLSIRSISNQMIWELDIASGRERVILDRPGMAVGSPMYLADGQSYAFKGVYRKAAKGSKQTALVRSKEKITVRNLFRARIGVQGFQPFFPSVASNRVLGKSADGKTRTYDPSVIYSRFWGISADQKTVAFEGGSPFGSDLFLTNGIEKRQITRSDSSPYKPELVTANFRIAAWSKDGLRIAFRMEDRQGQESSYWIGSVDGKELRKLNIRYSQ